MKLHSPRLLYTAGIAFGCACRCLFSTLRYAYQAPDQVSPYDGAPRRPFLYAVWHDSSVLATYGGRHKNLLALTSRHRDGTFASGVVGFAGVQSIRGSTARSGRVAARQLLRSAQSHSIVITPDGPQGPRRQLSDGIIFLSSRTGNPIVPTAYACTNAWNVPGSWSTLTIPKPFSQVALYVGQPITIPPNLPRTRIAFFRQKVQSAMHALQHEAELALLPERRTEPTAASRPPAATDQRRRA